MRAQSVGRLPWREDHRAPEGAGARPFGQVSRVMPNCPKPLSQTQSRCPASACGSAIRAGSTRAQSSGTSVGLGVEVSDCFCYGLTDRAPILSWAPSTPQAIDIARMQGFLLTDRYAKPGHSGFELSNELPLSGYGQHVLQFSDAGAERCTSEAQRHSRADCFRQLSEKSGLRCEP